MICTAAVNENCELKQTVLEFLDGCEAIRNIQFAGKKVLLKPNLVAPVEKAVTSLPVISAAAAFVKKKGGTPFLAEGAGYEFDTEKTFRILNIYQLGLNQGFKVVNLERGRFVETETGDRTFPVIQLASAAADADMIFNLPKLKRHSLTRVTFSAKNLMGLISRDSRRLLHSRGIERGICVLARTIKSDAILVDALHTNTKAVYGHTAFKGQLVAGTDPWAVDAHCCGQMGLDHKGIPHLLALAPDGSLPCHPQTGGGRPAKSGLENKLLRLGYQSIYTLDRLMASMGIRNSIVAQAHWFFGLRPAIGKANAEALAKGARICPVDAVDPERRRIIRKRCINVKCMRCIEVKPAGSFVVKGFRQA